MNPPTPGLRSFHNRTNSAARVEIIVPAGDELQVGDDVASQLEASASFTEKKPAPQKRTTSRKTSAKSKD